MKQDEEVANKAGIFVRYYYPSIIIVGLMDMERNYLTSFGKSNYAIYCWILLPILFLGFSYLCIFELDLNVRGAAITPLISFLIVYII